jgi:hypothetical protein
MRRGDDGFSICKPDGTCAPSDLQGDTVAVSEDGALLTDGAAIYHAGSDHKIALPGSGLGYFVGHTIAVRTDSCAVCSSTMLYDEKGRKIAVVGGSRQPANTFADQDAARAGGDVWVWDDSSKGLVFQDVKSGKVVAHVDYASIGVRPGAEEDDLVGLLVGTDAGVALVGRKRPVGDVHVLDAKGKLSKAITAPRCP